MAKQLPWDEETDGFISDLDSTVNDKYKISLRTLLINPNRYASKKDLADTISSISSDADTYFNALLDNLKDEQAKLESEMESANAQYKQIDSVISSKAASSRVPYVKPLYLSRDSNKEETIVIESYDDSMESFVGKLVSESNFVADISATYKQNRLGSWIFSGAKNYVLTINPPSSPVLVIENSRTIISDMLSDIAGRVVK